MTPHDRTARLPAEKLTDIAWFKSSYSDGGQQCIEVSDRRHTPGHCVAVRDSKDPDGPVLTFAPEEWTAFVNNVDQGLMPQTA